MFCVFLGQFFLTLVVPHDLYYITRQERNRACNKKKISKEDLALLRAIEQQSSTFLPPHCSARRQGRRRMHALGDLGSQKRPLQQLRQQVRFLDNRAQFLRSNRLFAVAQRGVRIRMHL